jgi:hypothetical protein
MRKEESAPVRPQGRCLREGASGKVIVIISGSIDLGISRELTAVAMVVAAPDRPSRRLRKH